MKISYDGVADALYIQFQPESDTVKETVKIRDGIFCDIDKTGRIFGIEVLDVSKRFPVEELGKLDIDLPVHAG